MRTLTYLVTSLLVLTAGCSAGSPAAPTQPGSFVLSPGQSASYGPVAVRFVGVSADSRCPGDALCLQFSAGDATVVVDTSAGGSSSRYELKVNDLARRRVVHGGFVIELSELAPYPFLSRPIAPGNYRASIVISRE